MQATINKSCTNKHKHRQMLTIKHNCRQKQVMQAYAGRYARPSRQRQAEAGRYMQAQVIRLACMQICLLMCGEAEITCLLINLLAIPAPQGFVLPSLLADVLPSYCLLALGKIYVTNPSSLYMMCASNL